MASNQYTTAAELDGIKSRAERFELADAAHPGLRVRVTPNGVKTFTWHVRTGGRTKRMTLGRFALKPKAGHLTLSQARSEVDRLKTEHGDGVLHVAQVDDPKTVDDLAELWLAHVQRSRKRPEEARQLYEFDVKKSLGKMKLRALRRGHVKKLIEAKREKAPGRAVKLLGMVKQLLAYGEKHGYLEHSPAAGYTAGDFALVTRSRDRYLDDDELRVFWHAIDRAPRMDQRTRIAYRILLLTAVRSGELINARWRDVDLEAGRWTIPVAHQKLTKRQAANAKPFVIQLSPVAVSLFERLQVLAGESPRVLPLSDKVLGKALRRMFELKIDGEPLLPVDYFVVHDLRRTVRAGLSRLGVDIAAAERVLNHKLPKLVTTYSPDEAEEARHVALARWAAHLEEVI